jgi:hypothetical protein
VASTRPPSAVRSPVPAPGLVFWVNTAFERGSSRRQLRRSGSSQFAILGTRLAACVCCNHVTHAACQRLCSYAALPVLRARGRFGCVKLAGWQYMDDDRCRAHVLYCRTCGLPADAVQRQRCKNTA